MEGLWRQDVVLPVAQAWIMAAAMRECGNVAVESPAKDWQGGYETLRRKGCWRTYSEHMGVRTRRLLKVIVVSVVVSGGVD